MHRKSLSYVLLTAILIQDRWNAASAGKVPYEGLRVSDRANIRVRRSGETICDDKSAIYAHVVPDNSYNWYTAVDTDGYLSGHKWDHIGLQSMGFIDHRGPALIVECPGVYQVYAQLLFYHKSAVVIPFCIAKNVFPHGEIKRLVCGESIPSMQINTQSHAKYHFEAIYVSGVFELEKDDEIIVRFKPENVGSIIVADKTKTFLGAARIGIITDSSNSGTLVSDANKQSLLHQLFGR